MCVFFLRLLLFWMACEVGLIDGESIRRWVGCRASDCVVVLGLIVGMHCIKAYALLDFNAPQRSQAATLQEHPDFSERAPESGDYDM